MNATPTEDEVARRVAAQSRRLADRAEQTRVEVSPHASGEELSPRLTEMAVLLNAVAAGIGAIDDDGEKPGEHERADVHAGEERGDERT